MELLHTRLTLSTLSGFVSDLSETATSWQVAQDARLTMVKAMGKTGVGGAHPETTPGAEPRINPRQIKNESVVFTRASNLMDGICGALAQPKSFEAMVAPELAQVDDSFRGVEAC